jgi:hypothetical protein
MAGPWLVGGWAAGFWEAKASQERLPQSNDERIYLKKIGKDAYSHTPTIPLQLRDTFPPAL